MQNRDPRKRSRTKRTAARPENSEQQRAIHLSAQSQVEGASSAQYWATTAADDNFKETFATRLALMRLVNRATHVR